MLGVQNRIKSIMRLEPNEREIELRKLAQKLGCSLSSTYSGDGAKHREEEVIRRIQEAARSTRESRLWLFALLSAISAILSAMAAWVAIGYK
jgi:hypothetical protein